MKTILKASSVVLALTSIAGAMQPAVPSMPMSLPGISMPLNLPVRLPGPVQPAAVELNFPSAGSWHLPAEVRIELPGPAMPAPVREIVLPGPRAPFTYIFAEATDAPRTDRGTALPDLKRAARRIEPRTKPDTGRDLFDGDWRPGQITIPEHDLERELGWR
jgi:hypothetical protein